MRKLILPAALFACVALAGCSAGGSSPEPSQSPESSQEAAQPTVSHTPSPSPSPSFTAPSNGTDVEAITTTAPASNALTEEQIAALPSEDADVYNECMVGEWQLSLDIGLEYDEEQAAKTCLIEVDYQNSMRGLSEDQFTQTVECLDYLQTNKPELFAGREWEEALEDPAVVAACQEYLGL